MFLPVYTHHIPQGCRWYIDASGLLMLFQSALGYTFNGFGRIYAVTYTETPLKLEGNTPQIL